MWRSTSPGSEVLWRMADVSLLWEIGKYAICAMMVVALWRGGRYKLHVPSAIYFLLLIPSAVITYSTLGFTDGRQPISFNLSVPLAIAVAVWFFSNITLTAGQVRRVLLIMAIPAMAVGAATLYAMLTAVNLRFSNNSNMESSGGYGPNQVSAVLGLEALLMVFYLLQGPAPNLLRAMLFACATFLAVQSAMTFSRGGLAGSTAAFAVALLFLLRDRGAAMRLLPLLLGAVMAVRPYCRNWKRSPRARWENVLKTPIPRIATRSPRRRWRCFGRTRCLVSVWVWRGRPDTTRGGV